MRSTVHEPEHIAAGALADWRRRSRKAIKREGVSGAGALGGAQDMGDRHEGHLRIGDVVEWRGCFGTAAPASARVRGLEVTEGPRQKYGVEVDSVSWDVVRENRVVVSLDNQHWAYGEQIGPAPVWLRFEECSDEQVIWGGNQDPRPILKPGGIYRQTRVKVFSAHTHVWVEVGEGCTEHGPFNSVCFTEVKP